MRSERGFALVWAAIAIFVMVFAATAAMEVARFHAIVAQTQTAVDAGALSGALSATVREERDEKGRVVGRRLVLDQAAAEQAAVDAVERNLREIRGADGYPKLASWTVTVDGSRATVRVEARVETRCELPFWSPVLTLGRWGEVQAGPIATTLVVSPDVVRLQPGQTTPVTVKARMSDGSEQDVTGEASYTPGDPLVVAVPNPGLLRALASGTTSVEISWAGFTVVCNVMCASPGLDVVPRPVEMRVGQSVSYWVVFRRPDGTALDVTKDAPATISDSSVARLNSRGVLVGCSPGVVTLSVSWNGYSTQCTVRVLP